ncbi:MAG: GNAT family N-acetyltransferase [Clostridiaceae bacterium]|mgnify:CR=1 FL=1|jgi:ribosomal-protein-alanine N-acetyltransferase|nr:GNAT family N-acetyltransferase [Clostridiaceae bacterium]
MKVPSSGLRINNRSIYIRDALPVDLDDVAMIDAQSFTSPWSCDALEPFIVTDDKNRFLLVAEVEPDPESHKAAETPIILGFVAVQVLIDVYEIQRIAVLSDVRNLGIGALLMAEVMHRGATVEAISIILEVGDGNREARRLYESFGFKIVGRRRSYYADTGEDAVLMTATPPFLLTKTKENL